MRVVYVVTRRCRSSIGILTAVAGSRERASYRKSYSCAVEYTLCYWCRIRESPDGLMLISGSIVFDLVEKLVAAPWKSRGW